MNTINNKVIEYKLVDRCTLSFDLNKDLKNFDDKEKEKLKKSLLGGIIQPYYVWIDEESKHQVLDGKHRDLVLDELLSEGYECNYVPVIYVNFASKEEALTAVLKYASHYAEMSNDNVIRFIEEHNLLPLEVFSVVALPNVSESRITQKLDIYDIPLLAEEAENELSELANKMEGKKSLIKEGDIFALNDCVLMCGSALNKEHVELLMGGNKAQIVFTDPPYNLPANFFTNKYEKVHNNFKDAYGELSDDEFKDFLKTVMQNSKDYSVSGSIMYLCMDFRHSWHVNQAGKECFGSYSPKQQCVWVKGNFGNGSFYRSEYEFVFIFKTNEGKHKSHLLLQDRVRSNVWRYPSAASFANDDRDLLKEHPTPKPVQMYADAYLDTTDAEDIVVDWFGGSGTAIIAAEITNRKAFCMEVMPDYCALIINRWYKHCKKNNKETNFLHKNGKLNLKDILWA